MKKPENRCLEQFPSSMPKLGRNQDALQQVNSGASQFSSVQFSSSVVSDSLRPLLLLSRFSRVRLCATPQPAAHQASRPWDSPGKNTGVGCHFLLQCMKVKSESEVAQPCPCPTLRDPMDCSLPGFSVHGVFQAKVLEWGAIAFSDLLLGRKIMTNLDSILKRRDITLPTKVHLVKAMVFPVVMYGCESWSIKKAELSEELMLLNCGVEKDY